jgi:hypothetical protein
MIGNIYIINMGIVSAMSKNNQENSSTNQIDSSAMDKKSQEDSNANQIQETEPTFLGWVFIALGFFR